LQADLASDKKRFTQMGRMLAAFEFSNEACAYSASLGELQLSQPESFAPLPNDGSEVLCADDPHFSDR